MRDRRVEESRDQEAQNPLTQNRDEHAEERTEEPFRSLRDFHERQRKEKQEEKRPRHSASSQSTPGGGRRRETKLSYDTEREYKNSRTQRSQHLPKPTTTPRLEGT